MAEGILRDLLEREGLGEEAEARSAGTWAVSGSPASENAVRASSELGIDIEEHRSTPLSRALVYGADLILTMEPGHLEEIVVHVPEARGKAHLLTSYADPENGSARGVDDPIGGDLAAYQHTCRELHELLTAAVPRIAAEVREALDGANGSRGNRG
jgi:protein-tyrosine phosphatase